MVGKVIIDLDENNRATVQSNLKGQDLYRAYTALTAHIACSLINKEDIRIMAKQAAEDALKMMGQ